MALLSGELAPAERARVNAHIDGCPSCLSLVAALGRTEHEDPREDRSAERYEIHEEIGAGGMGQVFEAFDTVLGRRVALKCVRSGPEDRSAAMRFEREMALTARLQHPSIIPVYDAGLFPDGSRYFAMRLVEGDTLDKAIASTQSRQERFALVPGIRRACEAVAYAHENGVVHRDLKPANILIGPFGETVVLDWGLAKALEDDDAFGDSVLTTAGDDDGMTRPGAVMGTVGYIAPEISRGDAAAPWSDVFSLGRVLARLLDANEGERTEAENDLAAIVARATADAPEDRYPHASALCDDLRRFEAGRAVLARDYSIRSRVIRFARRHRTLLASSVGFVGVGLLSGVVATRVLEPDEVEPCQDVVDGLDGVWDETRRDDVRRAFAEIERPHAASSWARIERDVDARAEAMVQMRTDACLATARGEQSAELMDLRMRCLDRSTVELSAAVDVLAQVDASVLDNADMVVRALRPISQCADTDTLRSGQEPPTPIEASAVEAARIVLARATALRRATRYDEARAAVDETRALLEGIEYANLRAELAIEDGMLRETEERIELALEQLSEAVTLGTRTKQWDIVRDASVALMGITGDTLHKPDEALRYQAIAEGLSLDDPRAENVYRANLAAVYFAAGRQSEGTEELRKAVVAAEATEDPQLTADTQISLGLGLVAQGKYEEAETLLRPALSTLEDTLGPDDPRVAEARVNLGELLVSQGRYVDAEPEVRSALAVLEQAYSPMHHEVAEARTILGFALYFEGEHAQSETEFRRAIEILGVARGTEHPTYTLAHYSLGYPLIAQRKFAEAEAAYRTALGAAAILGEDHPTILDVRAGLASSLRESGKLSESEAEYRTLIATMVSTDSGNSTGLGVTRGSFAELLWKRDKWVEAEVELRAAMELLEKDTGGTHPQLPRLRASLARVLAATERVDEAIPLAESAWKEHDVDTVAPEERARTAFILARVLWRADADAHEKRVLELVEDARTSYSAAKPPRTESLEDIERWVVEQRVESAGG